MKEGRNCPLLYYVEIEKLIEILIDIFNETDI